MNGIASKTITNKKGATYHVVSEHPSILGNAENPAGKIPIALFGQVKVIHIWCMRGGVRGGPCLRVI